MTRCRPHTLQVEPASEGLPEAACMEGHSCHANIGTNHGITGVSSTCQPCKGWHTESYTAERHAYLDALVAKGLQQQGRVSKHFSSCSLHFQPPRWSARTLTYQAGCSQLIWKGAHLTGALRPAMQAPFGGSVGCLSGRRIHTRLQQLFIEHALQQCTYEVFSIDQSSSNYVLQPCWKRVCRALSTLQELAHAAL